MNVHLMTIYRWEWSQSEPSRAEFEDLVKLYRCSEHRSWVAFGEGTPPLYLTAGDEDEEGEPTCQTGT